jgi:outer membrane protein TolC
VPIDDIDYLTADVDLAQQKAVQLALTNSWDMMNARAQVQDAWRQLRVSANALLGVFNTQYNLASATPTGNNNPFAFSGAGTTQQLSINFQLPLNRLAQRNAYRTSIINYQQARRNLMNLEDSIAAQVRFDVRQLHLFAENYKILQKLGCYNRCTPRWRVPWRSLSPRRTLTSSKARARAALEPPRHSRTST